MVERAPCDGLLYENVRENEIRLSIHGSFLIDRFGSTSDSCKLEGIRQAQYCTPLNITLSILVTGERVACSSGPLLFVLGRERLLSVRCNIYLFPAGTVQCARNEQDWIPLCISRYICMFQSCFLQGLGGKSTSSTEELTGIAKTSRI